MWFKHRAWIPVAWLLSLGNLIAVWPAAQGAEPAHAAIHALLAVAFALGARRLTERRRAGAQGDAVQPSFDQFEPGHESVDVMQTRLQELEERVDFAERMLAKHRDRESSER